jgi:hypothetical protein
LPLFIPLITSAIISITNAIIEYFLRRTSPTPTPPQQDNQGDIITNITEKNDIINEKEQSFISIDIIKHHHIHPVPPPPPPPLSVK